ncbi:hypothetical protein [Deinococcus roseus]|uniref:Uncharacterized protein n=1 Tax=Deinococcus roseus TaxID=392414 RepID=A0ABQ2CWM4_9DEIO|nr:hypothetical protein [Deinococcus roseus]GGJ28004.1 hypothetical protein GCM10008938_12600 [Deinococcus roseus]
MAPELTALLYFVGVILLAGIIWRFRVPRTGYRDVQVVYEDAEWCVYGITHTGEKVLIDAFPQQTEALACAYKLAAAQNISQDDLSEDQDDS